MKNEKIIEEKIKASGEPLFVDVTNKGKNKYEYNMKKIRVTLPTVHRISLLNPPFGYARRIRAGQVNKLRQLLEKGDHFESALYLEKKNSGTLGYRVIDGGHRINAIKKFLEKAPKGSSVTFYAGVYDFNGMSDSERQEARRQIYRKHNIGTKQSTDDFIQSYRDNIPMFDRIAGNNKNIPCTVYGKKEGKNDTLKFKDFVGGYFAGIYKAKQKNGFKGGYSGNAQRFVDECMNRPLSIKDVKNIEFVWDTMCKTWDITEPYNFLKKAKQPPTVENSVTKTTPFYAVTRVILDNKDKFSQEELISRLQRDTVREAIILLSGYGGRSSCITCHKVLHNALNVGYEDNPKKQFLPILNEEELETEKFEIESFAKIKGIDGIKTDENELEMVEEDVPEEVLEEDEKSKWSKFKSK